MVSFLGQLTGPVPPVTGNQLIAALRVRSSNRRDQNTILLDTVGGLHHGLVILDFEGVVPEGMQLRQRDFPYFFQLGILAAFLSGKQVIYRGQFYLFSRCFSSFNTSFVRFSIPLCHLSARVMGEKTFSLCADFL